MSTESNQRVYSEPATVAYYANAAELFPAERYLFSKYLFDGADVLDVGVGGGRTVPQLSTKARHYLGVDYSEEMVAECRRRFPGLRFEVADATDLTSICDESFDVTIFSFNGIDYICPDEARVACLRELKRVTRSAGWVIISSHNARALAAYPELEGAGMMRKIWRLTRTAGLTTLGAARIFSRRAFWQGSGYVQDPVHGGLLTHVSSPPSIARDCAMAGLTVVERVGHLHPKKVPNWLNPWSNFVLRKAG